RCLMETPLLSSEDVVGCCLVESPRPCRGMQPLVDPGNQMSPTRHDLINSLINDIRISGKMNRGTAGGEMKLDRAIWGLPLADLNLLLSLSGSLPFQVLSSPISRTRTRARCYADGGLGGGGHHALLARRRSSAVWMGLDAIVAGGSRCSRP
ncbi:hypothetical protein ACLOJK_036724, partial [Asimina triloba]